MLRIGGRRWDRRNYEATAKVSLLFQHYLIVSELGNLKCRGKRVETSFSFEETLFTKLVNRRLNRNARRYS